jgi:regulator of sigma E protease
MFLSVIIFIISLLILVVIHELGHFLMAKKFGIKVLEFGFGIPPRAWGKKIGETLVSINWLPFGGFVRLLGEDETDKKVLLDKRSYAAQTVGKRITVVIAGIVMNLVLSWVLFYIVIASQDWRVIYPTPEPVVSVLQVEKGMPAEKVGLKPGDLVLEVNGQKVTNIDEVRNIIRQNEGKTVNLKISNFKTGQDREVSVVPEKAPSGQVLIGVAFSPIAYKQYNTPVEKLFSGISYSFDLIILTFKGLGTLVADLATGNVGKASAQVAGPIGLAVVSNNILSSGWEATIPYLWFTGLISLTLAVMNFLPIPALDGGRLLFLYIEALTKKKLSAELEAKIHGVGFAILLMLMILIAMADVKKFF